MFFYSRDVQWSEEGVGFIGWCLDFFSNTNILQQWRMSIIGSMCSLFKHDGHTPLFLLWDITAILGVFWNEMHSQWQEKLGFIGLCLEFSSKTNILQQWRMSTIGPRCSPSQKSSWVPPWLHPPFSGVHRVSKCLCNSISTTSTSRLIVMTAIENGVWHTCDLVFHNKTC